MANSRADANSELSAALAPCRSAVVSLTVFSMFANLLMLTGPLFMLQVYDRVLTSGSMPTLVALAILAAVLYALYGFLDFIRSRLLVRVGRIFDESLRDRVFEATAQHSFRSGLKRNEALSDLQTIRQFLQGNGPIAFLDMPWAPIYLALIFAMHVMLGWLALVAGVVLTVIAIVTEQVTRKHAAEAQKAIGLAGAQADQCRTNIEVATILGMVGRLRQRWARTQDEALASHMLASDRSGMLTTLSRTLRLVFQSAVLGLGAYLALKREVSPGVMIAASIIMARALAPIETAVSQWPQFQSFRRSWQRLKLFLSEIPKAKPRMELPRPTGKLAVENLSAYVPGVEKPIVGNVSFTLETGDGLGIIGPTGAGKSTLARALVGAWPLTRGSVRLDGATPDQWDPNVLGRSIGYLSQESELFDGTIAENISRFEESPDPKAIVDAAQQADIHTLVLSMPDGYNTLIGQGGRRLSAGQRQRLGLARALYGNPSLVVLDEPNANLDATGETALVRAIAGVRQRGGTVIVIAHRPSAIGSLDKLMVVGEGRVIAFGPKDEILAKVLARPVDSGGRPGGLTVVTDARGSA
ncbi:MAG: type I secretion system permease/ATPase [Hyphomicrobiales bacterium]